MTFEYKPNGICATNFCFEIEDNIIKDVKIDKGCPGNLLGIKSLIKDRNIDDIIELLSGIECGVKDTSCPDQISKALLEFKQINQ